MYTQYTRMTSDEFEEDSGETMNPSENVIYLNGVISSQTVGPTIAFIIGANAANAYDEIFLFINSSGGSLSEGFALANIIRSSKIPIITVALGECDSSALMIAMSGHYRFVMEDTSLLSHQYSAGIGLTKHNDIQARMKDLTLTAKKVVRHYMKCTGLEETKILSDLVKETDVFLTPEEAVGYRIFDEVLTDFSQIFTYNQEDEEDIPLNEEEVV